MIVLSAMLAAQPCSRAPSGLDERLCVGRLAEQVEGELNHQWRITLAALRKEDVENRRNHENKPDLASGLIASQRAWLRYREAQCEMVADESAGGTGYGELGSICEITLSRERIELLKLRAVGRSASHYSFGDK